MDIPARYLATSPPEVCARTGCVTRRQRVIERNQDGLVLVAEHITLEHPEAPAYKDANPGMRQARRLA